MKLSMLPIVQRTVKVREDIDQLLAAIETDAVQVIIRSTYQDSLMVDQVKPVIIAELKARRESLDRDLESYGVTLDNSPAVPCLRSAS